ncbi:hypothetical protein ACE6H2_017508 [Prunus campanulata]
MSSNTHGLPLHTHKPSRRTTANRIFVVLYGCATLALLSHHALSLLNSTTLTSFFITLTFLISDSILAFMFATTQSFHMRSIYHKEFPKNLRRVVEESDFPTLEVMYKRMEMRVKNVIERGKVAQEYITGEEEIQAFSKWTEEFTRQDHPTVIQRCITTYEVLGPVA